MKGLNIIKFTCYTIGHSKHTIEQFINLVNPHRIDLVIDIRSIPYSRYAPQFNVTSIKNSLGTFGLKYKYMGDVIGGKFSGSEFLDENSCLDFYKVVKNESFQKGIDIVIDKIKSGLNIVLMCAEKDPLYCHRFLLVSRELNNRGVSIIHLMADGSEINNDEFVNEIVYNKTKSGFIQMNFFSKNDETLENKVYKLLMMKKMKK